MGCCCNGGNSNGGSWVEGNFTIIYPNNGSKDKPADVKANERIVLDNPFKGSEQVNGTVFWVIKKNGMILGNKKLLKIRF